jgi:hypothetical protein
MRTIAVAELPGPIVVSRSERSVRLDICASSAALQPDEARAAAIALIEAAAAAERPEPPEWP